MKECYRCNQIKEVDQLIKASTRGSTMICKSCNWLKQKAWRVDNREKYLQQRKEDNVRRHAKRKGITAEQYQSEGDARKARRVAKELKRKSCRSTKCPLLRANPKLDYLVNTEYYLAKSRKYYENNRSKALRKVRRWKVANPAKTAAHAVKRRSRLDAVQCSLTEAEWGLIKHIYKNKCAYCNRKRPLSIDHVMPISKGGPHTADNVVPACRSCNSRKGNRNVHVPLQMHLVMQSSGS